MTEPEFATTPADGTTGLAEGERAEATGTADGEQAAETTRAAGQEQGGEATRTPDPELPKPAKPAPEPPKPAEPPPGLPKPAKPEPTLPEPPTPAPIPVPDPALADSEAAEPAAEGAVDRRPAAESKPAAEPEPAAEAEPVPPVLDGTADSEPGAEQAASVAPDAPEPEAVLPVPVAAEADEEAEDSRLPDLSDDSELDGALESVLLVVDTPIAEEQLAGVFEQPVKRVTAGLRRIAARYTEQGSGIDLRRIGDGWRFYTRDRFAPFVEKLLLDGQRAKLTRAALETLAVIAYRQPVTRARVAAVRGVNVDGVIRTLVARGLIAETGTDADTGGILYRTTELFLERLGLASLSDLPPIAPLLPEVDAIDDV